MQSAQRLVDHVDDRNARDRAERAGKRARTAAAARETDAQSTGGLQSCVGHIQGGYGFMTTGTGSMRSTARQQAGSRGAASAQEAASRTEAAGKAAAAAVKHQQDACVPMPGPAPARLARQALAAAGGTYGWAGPPIARRAADKEGAYHAAARSDRLCAAAAFHGLGKSWTADPAFDLKQLTMRKLDLGKDVDGGYRSHSMGRSGFGECYQGTCSYNHVTMKIFHHSLRTGNKSAMMGCLHENQYLWDIRHRNLVNVYGLAVRDGDVYGVITEYLDGGSMHDAARELREQFGDSAMLDRANQLRLLQGVRDCAGGMVELHRRGRIHSHLNPRNMLLVNKLDKDRLTEAKVGDIGLSYLNAFNSDCNDANYAAPEQLGHGQHVGQQQRIARKIDIYAFGVCLWAIFTGCALEPFRDVDPAELKQGGHFTSGKRPSIPGWLQDSLPDVCNLMKRCWNVDPEVRPEFYQVREILDDVTVRMECEQGQVQPRRRWPGDACMRGLPLS